MHDEGNPLQTCKQVNMGSAHELVVAARNLLGAAASKDPLTTSKFILLSESGLPPYLHPPPDTAICKLC